MNTDMIYGLLYLLLFQASGEILSKFLIPLITGPVLGLTLLLVFLGFKKRVPSQIEMVGNTVLSHLGLLFVPASVGIVMYLPLLREHFLAVILALTLSVMATILVTALVLKAIAPLRAEDEHAG